MKNKQRIKEEKITKKPRKKSGLSKFFNAILNGEFLTREGFVRHMPFVVFLSFLFIVYIAMGYFYENTLRDLAKYKTQLDDTKNSYHTTLSELETIRLKTSVAVNLKEMGFSTEVNQPKIIERVSE